LIAITGTKLLLKKAVLLPTPVNNLYGKTSTFKCIRNILRANLILSYIYFLGNTIYVVKVFKLIRKS
jgi:uncharacterized protein YqhQ